MEIKRNIIAKMMSKNTDLDRYIFIMEYLLISNVPILMYLQNHLHLSQHSLVNIFFDSLFVNMISFDNMHHPYSITCHRFI